MKKCVTNDRICSRLATAIAVHESIVDQMQDALWRAKPPHIPESVQWLMQTLLQRANSELWWARKVLTNNDKYPPDEAVSSVTAAQLIITAVLPIVQQHEACCFRRLAKKRAFVVFRNAPADLSTIGEELGELLVGNTN